MAVYFIREKCYRGKIKIGYSQDPSKRLKDLQTANSNELGLVATIDYGTEQTEKEIHSYFFTKHIHGEWYDITTEQVEKICQMYKSSSEIKNVSDLYDSEETDTEEYSEETDTEEYKLFCEMRKIDPKDQKSKDFWNRVESETQKEYKEKFRFFMRKSKEDSINKKLRIYSLRTGWQLPVSWYNDAAIVSIIVAIGVFIIMGVLIL